MPQFAGPSTSEREAKYRTVLTSGAGASPVVAAQLDEMARKFKVSADVQKHYMDRVKHYVNAIGIPGYLLPYCYAFANRGMKINQAYSAEGRAIEYTPLIALYVARGLPQAVLEGIRDHILLSREITGP